MKNSLYPLIVIIVFALLIRIIFFIGPAIADEFAYFQYAHNIFSGKFDITSGTWYAFRFMIFLPVGLFFKLLSISDYSASIWPLLCSLGGVILIYLIGRLLFNTQVATLAASLLSIFPLDVVFATHVMPDTILPFFMALSIYFFLKADSASFTRGPSVLYIFSGLALGLGYFSREIAPILFFLFFIAYVLYRRSFKLQYILIFLGFLSIIFIELIFYYFSSGDPFLRWRIAGDFYGNQKLPANLLYYPKAIFSPLGQFGIYYYFIFCGFFYLLFTKKLRYIAIPSIWFFSSFLYWEFGTMSLSRFAPLFKEARFLSQLSIPAILISSYFLMNLPYLKKPLHRNLREYLRKTLIIIFITAVVTIPFFYLFKDQVFIIMRYIYILSKHTHSFEENIEIINNLYKTITLFLPLFIILCSALSFLIIRSKKIVLQYKLISLIFLLILLPTSILSINIYSSQYKASIEKYKIVYKFISDSGCRPAYFMHWRWPIILSYYFKYKEGSNFLRKGYLDYPKSPQGSSIFKYVRNINNLNQLQGSCVVVDKEFLSEFLGSRKPPEFVYHIPKNWEARKSFGDVIIYHVD